MASIRLLLLLLLLCSMSGRAEPPAPCCYRENAYTKLPYLSEAAWTDAKTPVGGLSGVWNPTVVDLDGDGKNELVVEEEVGGGPALFAYRECEEGGNNSMISVAVCADLIVAGGSDGSISSWNATSGNDVFVIRNAHDGPVRALAFGPGPGCQLLSAGTDALVKAWQAPSGFRMNLTIEANVTDMVLYAGTNYLIACSPTLGVIAWDVRVSGWRHESVWRHETAVVKSLTLIGSRLFGAGDRIWIWDASTGRVLSSISEPSSAVTAFGGVIFSGNLQGNIVAFNSSTGLKLSPTVQAHDAGLEVKGLRVLQGKLLSVGGFSAAAWEVPFTGRLLWRQNASLPINSLALCAGRLLLASDTVRSSDVFHSLHGGKALVIGQPGPFTNATSPVKNQKAVVFSLDGSVGFIGGTDEAGLPIVASFDVATGQAKHVFERAHAFGTVRALVLDSTESNLFVVGDDLIIGVWDITTQPAGILRLKKTISQTLTSVIAPASSSMLITGSYDNSIQFWNRSSPTLAHLFSIADAHATGTGSPTGGNGVRALAATPDGSSFFSSGQGGDIRCWDTLNGDPLYTIVGAHSPSDVIRAITISPDGKKICSAGSWDGDVGQGTVQDGSIKCWDARREGRFLFSTASSHGPSWGISSLSFTPDGGKLVSVSPANTLTTPPSPTYLSCVDANTGLKLNTLPSSADGFMRVTPDGSTVVTGATSMLQLWAVPNLCTRPAETFDVHALALDVMPNASKLFVANKNQQTLNVFDLSSSTIMRETSAAWEPSEGISGMLLTPSGDTLITSSNVNIVSNIVEYCFWCVESGLKRHSMRLRFLDLPGSEVVMAVSTHLLFVSEWTQIPTISTISAFNVSSGLRMPRAKFEFTTPSVTSVVFTALAINGEVLFAAAHDSRMGHREESIIFCHDIETGRQIFGVLATGSVYRMVFFPPSNTLFIASSSPNTPPNVVTNNITALNASSGFQIYVIQAPHNAPVNCLAVSETYLFSGSGSATVLTADNSIDIWDPLSGDKLQTLANGHDTLVLALAVTRDGSSVIARHSGGVLKVWSLPFSKGRRQPSSIQPQFCKATAPLLNGETIAFADFIAHDKKMDAVVSDANGRLTAWRNIGAVGKSPQFVQQPTDMFASSDRGRRPEFVDLDGDSQVELVASDLTDGLLMWAFDGSTFTLTPQHPLRNVKCRGRCSATFSDIDHDGDLDLVVGSGAQVGVWLNTGTRFAPRFDSQLSKALLQNLGIGNSLVPHFADVNAADNTLLVGTEDGVIVTYTRTQLTDAAPVFQMPGVGLGDITCLAGSSPAFGDVNGDGLVDAVVGGANGKAALWLNTGQGFVRRDNLDFVAVGARAVPALADLNADGLPDLVIGNASGHLTVLLNLNTAFVEIGLVGSTMKVPSFAAPALVDLDGDSDNDLVVGDGDGHLQVLVNTGNASVPQFQLLLDWNHAGNPFQGMSFGNNAAPAFADLNYDGRVDAIVGNADGHIHYLRNTLSNGLSRFDDFSWLQYENPFRFKQLGRLLSPAFVRLGSQQFTVTGSAEHQNLTSFRSVLYEYDKVKDCHQHGTFSEDPAGRLERGQCSCNPLWGHVSNCGQCSAGKWGPLCDNNCPATSMVCNAAGRCSEGTTGLGNCSCSGYQYTGLSCSDCQAGFNRSSSLGGLVSCLPCTRGQFRDSTMEKCERCTPGDYAVVTASTECLTCPLGYECKEADEVPRRCGRGTFRNTSMAACQDCASGDYQDKEAQSSCLQCPAGSSCPEASNPPQSCRYRYFSSPGMVLCDPCPVLIDPFTNLTKRTALCVDGHLQTAMLNSTYWTNASRVYKCAFEYAASCIVIPKGEQNSTMTETIGRYAPVCGNNRAGKLCQSCAIGFNEVSGQCMNCEQSVVISTVKFALAAVSALFGFQYLLTWVGRSAPKEWMTLQGLLFDYTQMVSLLSIFKFEWPAEVKEFFGVAAIGRVQFQVSPCSTATAYQTRLAIGASMFFILAAAFLLFIGSKYFRSCKIRNKDRTFRQWFEAHDYHRSFRRGNKFLYTLASPTVATIGYEHFNCLHIDGRWWIKSELSQECYSPEWYSMSVIAVFCILVAVVPPVVIIIYIYRHDRRTDNFATYWGHWTFGFNANAWWFESFRLLRKQLFILSAIMFSKDASMQALSATMFTTFSLALTALSRPYVFGWIDVVDSAGQAVIIMCVLVGLVFCSDCGDTDPEHAQVATLLIVSLATLWFVFILVLMVYCAYSDVRRSRLRTTEEDAVDPALDTSLGRGTSGLISTEMADLSDGGHKFGSWRDLGNAPRANGEVIANPLFKPEGQRDSIEA